MLPKLTKIQIESTDHVSPLLLYHNLFKIQDPRHRINSDSIALIEVAN